MTQLTALHAKITGDATSLVTETNRAQTALRKTGTQVQTMGRQVGALPRQSLLAGNGMRMLSLQLSQVGQQAMAGGNFVRALAIQLPDIGLAFGTVGTAVGLLAGLALPLLWDSFNKTKESADTLKNALAELRSIKEILSMDTDTLAKAYGQAADAVRKFAHLRAQMRMAAIAEEMGGFQAIIKEMVPSATAASRFIGEAASKTQVLAKEWGVTNEQAAMMVDALEDLAEAENVATLTTEMDQFKAALEKAGIEARKLPADFANSLNKLILAHEELAAIEALFNAINDAGNDDAPPPKRTGTDRLKGELDSLRRALATETELAQMEYDKRHDILVRALDRDKLTKEEYQKLEQRSAADHAEALRRIDEQRQQAQISAQASFFGSLAKMAQAGGEKAFRAAKFFGAAEALINAWGAYTKALNAPGPLDPWTRLAAGAAVLSAGMQAVSAIRSATPGSAGGGAAVAAPAAAAPTTAVNIRLGGDNFSRGSVQQLIEQIGETLGDGARIRVV